jgi:1,4-alpha-glucan branching enzyme
VQPTEPDVTRLIAIDPWLAPYEAGLRRRADHFRWLRRQIAPDGDLLGPVSQGHRHFGFNRGELDGSPGLWYREWAPGAGYLALIGEFNGWDRGAHAMSKDVWGVWELFLPDRDGEPQLAHASPVKVHVGFPAGAMDRIPAYIRRTEPEPGTSHYTGVYWDPPGPYRWRHDRPGRKGGMRIYEAHVGMAREDGRIGTFDEFREQVLPRIARAGYNALQLMAVMEHPYYASFGYHVSSFFAVSSRFGTPEQLKALVDEAHGLGIRVIMDLIHSHAIKNVLEGLAWFDGTDHQYFHAGARGEHFAWDSMCFDYGKHEVLRFLLSNVRFWLEEFRMDGFRLDGVTSMMYHDHGHGRAFTSYDDYFSGNVDDDAVAYLMLANDLAHRVDPGAVTIAEDVSGMAGIARPVAEGGLGFDYRLAMGVPDMWIRLLKEQRDEEWSLGGIYRALIDRRPGEKTVGYVESHDQALVGDKTVAFWLMDARMYWNMTKFAQDPVIDRGVAYHKMIRLVTFALAGEAYLNFMGNEFGHPEWIDFPREGNAYSHHYARRQWSLADQDHLYYSSLAAFDRAMMALDERYGLLEDPFIEEIAVHEDTRQLAFRRGPLVFVFNLHPTESFVGLRVPVPDPCDYQVVLDTDAVEFGGQGRVAVGATYPCQPVPMYARGQSAQIYIPARSAQVLAPK